MYNILQADLDNLDEILSITKDKALSYLQQLNEAAVSTSALQPAEQISLPVDGTGVEQAIRTFYRQHQGAIVATSGPRYWGYVVGGATPAAIAGDWLTTVFDQNPQGTKGGGDISAIIEYQTIDWLLELFGLPKVFKGGFVTGATMSNFTCLAVGRQWAGKMNNNDIARDGIQTEIRILTATPHSSSVKSLSMLGLGSCNIIEIGTAKGNREAIDLNSLEQKLIENENYPVPENSRRLRALPVWFSLYAYGKKGYQWIVENNIELANKFALLLQQKTIFKLAAPVRLNVVCFTIEDKTEAESKLTIVLKNLNISGKLFVTPTFYKGLYCLRAAFVNWQTTEKDVAIAIDELIQSSTWPL